MEEEWPVCARQRRRLVETGDRILGTWVSSMVGEGVFTEWHQIFTYVKIVKVVKMSLDEAKSFLVISSLVNFRITEQYKVKN